VRADTAVRAGDAHALHGRTGDLDAIAALVNGSMNDGLNHATNGSANDGLNHATNGSVTSGLNHATDGRVNGAPDSGGALLVVGAAGIGRSTVLRVAAERATARGAMVLRAAGVEQESELPFAGLHQVLHPVLDALPRLAERHRTVLSVALGMADGAAPPPSLVSEATRALCRQAAGTRPLLLVIDDFSWLDAHSGTVLASLPLARSRLGILAAARHDAGPAHRRGGMRVHRLEPLDDDAATALLADRFPDLSAPVRQRVLAEACGNPLALVELPSALRPAQRSGRFPLPELLPLTRRLQTAFGSRVVRLPPSARRLLLIAALDGAGELGTMLPPPGATTAKDLRLAEEAGLIRVANAGTRLVFQHPLTRSAVGELSTAAERRRAHQALADRPATDPGRRAWHLAHASVGPDGRIAELLEQVARQARRRGDTADAVAALTRAATLSPDDRDRGRRLAAAAYLGAEVTGDLLDVPRLLEHAQPGPEKPPLSAVLAAAHHLVLSGDGEVDTAHGMLMAAVDGELESSAGPSDVLFDALYAVVWICFFAGRAELWQPLERAVRRLGPGAPPSLALLISCFADPVGKALPALPRLDDAVDTLASGLDPLEVIRIGTASLYVGRLAGCRPALQAVLRDGRDGRNITLAIQAMSLLSRHCYESGEWADLARLSDEGLRLSGQHGYRLLRPTFLHRQALLAATRGDVGRAERLADEITRFAASRRIRVLLLLAAEVRTRAALAREEFEEAYLQATSVSGEGVLAAYEGTALWMILDLVEATVRTGRHSEAEAQVAALRRARLPEISDRLALMTAGAAAFAAGDETFVGLFEHALAMADAGSWPFEYARIQLFYGERLRRVKAQHLGRGQLAAALETFRQLGAEPWAERASSELRASGLPDARPPAAVGARLSPQQQEIATLAASGLTNKQIAERLHLSPRTVGTHLYQIFPKLGVTSRAALRDALR